MENSKTATKFTCEICDFHCNKQSNFDSHLLTRKHLGYSNDTNDMKKQQKNATDVTTCECGKMYKHHSGLWRHQKQCMKEDTKNVSVQDPSNNDLVHFLMKENSEFKTMLMEMVKSNAELQKQMLEVCRTNQQQPSTNINNNNNNNKTTTFNMQVFLNETCKDAMNLKEFVDSIQLTLADFEMVGEKGLVDGLSNIIINSLRATDLNRRPIHCSDAKREVMYVKENDKWEKDGPKNDKVRHVVQNVEHKNIRLLVDYCKENPDCMDPDSPTNDNYLHMSSIATSGTDEHLDKIITKIAKEVVIDK